MSITATAVKTKGITNTKLLVATLCFLAASGVALAMMPSASQKAVGGAGLLLCSDTDGGNIPYLQGKTVANYGGIGIDACISTTTLREYFCLNKYTVTSTLINCATLIARGRCASGICFIPTSTLISIPIGPIPPSPISSRLSVSWAGDTPSGIAVGSYGARVANIVVTTGDGPRNYVIRLMNFALRSYGIVRSPTEPRRNLRVYKDYIMGTNLLATYTYASSTSSTFDFYDTAITDSDFQDVIMSPNSSKTFIVTLDTVDALLTSPRAYLSISMANDDLWWNVEGGSIQTVVSGLPLPWKTMNYMH